MATGQPIPQQRQSNLTEYPEQLIRLPLFLRYPEAVEPKALFRRPNLINHEADHTAVGLGIAGNWRAITKLVDALARRMSRRLGEIGNASSA